MKGNETKNAIAQALKQLLQRRPINKITINDIAEECGISRMTFYYHFKDIYDLADWTVQDTLYAVIGEHRKHGNWQQGFLDLLTVLQENKALILNVHRSIDRQMVERYMLREVETLLLPVVEEESEGMEISDQGKHAVAVFYTYAFLGVVLDWIRQGMQTAPQKVAGETATLIQGDFKNSLANMARMEAEKAKAKEEK
ncbi:MAG: TetR/AcrR family transcriptional regulator C-terminal domain-containing protein [Clostridia bacterium]|nr:TetR/AcrR family transcriptional regulator C-terminal domain-containing protein [Clostridia bacterium]